LRVLIIEDNREIGETIVSSLRDMGIANDWFAEGRFGIEATKSAEYDLIILDLNLPDKDGLNVLKELRRDGTNTPILIVSARISIDDRVKGLDLGADDYLVKPFDLFELEARVRALLRRNTDSRLPILEFGDLTFDQRSREFRVNGDDIDLSPRERSVLEILIRQNGNVISKERIAHHVFNFDDEASLSSIELYVHRLRKKFAQFNFAIVTKRGLGYALNLVK